MIMEMDDTGKTAEPADQAGEPAESADQAGEPVEPVGKAAGSAATVVGAAELGGSGSGVAESGGRAVGPTAAVIGLLGLVVAAGALWFAGRHAEDAAARILGEVAAVSGVLAVAAAVRGALLELAGRPGKALQSTVRAGSSVICGLILITVASIFQLVTEPRAPREPQVSAQVSGPAGQMILTVRVSAAHLGDGGVLDAALTAISEDETRTLLARELTPAGRAGTVTTVLTAALPDNGSVLLEVKTPHRKCRQNLPFREMYPRFVPLDCE